MTETDTIDPELEERARELLAAATAEVRSSATLDARVGALTAMNPTGRLGRWIAAAAVVALLAGGVWMIGDDGRRSSDVEVRDKPVAPTIDVWWTDVTTTWTDLPLLPSPPGYHVGYAIADALELWIEDSTNGGWAKRVELVGDRWERVGPEGSIAGGFARTSELPGWYVSVTPEAPRAGRASYSVASLSAERGSGTPMESWTDQGSVDGLDPQLGQQPLLLPIPEAAGGGIALISHENGTALGGLVVERVGAGREPVGTIPVPNLRPLAVGVSPDDEPVVLTQVIDGARLPSMLIAWALTADGSWNARGSATFGEADARWVGDRFVVVTNQHDRPEGSAAVELVLGPVGSDTTWKALADPGIGSCEGPVETLADEQGGVVATSCNGSAYLAPGEATWKPVPKAAGGWSLPLAMWDGRLVAQVSEGSGADPSARLQAIDLRLDR